MKICADLTEAIPDLVAGGVAEPARSELLAHAARCAPCSAALAETMTVADGLLAFAPHIEPPPGFETRAVATMAEGWRGQRGLPRARRRPSRDATVLAAAVAAAVLVVCGVVVGRVTGDGPASGEVEVAVVRTAGGDRLGLVEIDRSEPAKVIISVDGEQSWRGEWTCEMRGRDGRWVRVGTWTADEVTNGVWAAGLPAAAADATEMRILSSSGRVIATASLE